MLEIDEVSGRGLQSLANFIEISLGPVGLDSCIMGTAIVIDVLREGFGIEAVQQPCRTIVMNRIARKLMEAGVPMEDPRFRQNGAAAFVMGAERPGGPQLGKWAGHLVALTDHWVVDATLGQATRPDLGIEAGAVILSRRECVESKWPAGGDEEWLGGETPNGGIVAYQASNDHDYQTALDWQLPIREFLAKAYVAVLRADGDPADVYCYIENRRPEAIRAAMAGLECHGLVI